MDFSISDEQRMILETVRAFCTRELVPLEDEVRRAEIEGRRFPDDETLRALQAKAKAVGLWGISEPANVGGADLDAVTSALVSMETSRFLIPFRYGGEIAGAMHRCSPEQRERYLLPTLAGERILCFGLSEPDSGSDATALRTRAVKRGSKWVINGAKSWISRGDVADYALVFAVTDREKRHRGGITAFLVDREMGWKSRAMPVMAHSDIADHPPAELFFDDVEVPEENVLGEVGDGFKLAIESIGAARIRAPARAIGAATRLLEMAIEFAKSRNLRGKTLAEHQAIQWMLADCGIEIQTTKLAVLHAAWVADRGGPARFEQSIAKLYGAQAANRIADRVLQIHGAMGYSKELPIERVLRALRVYRIYEGSDEVQKQNIANELLARSSAALI